MGFEQGHQKVGGRKAGTPNRATAEMKKTIEEILGKSIPERLLELARSDQHNPETELKTLLVLMSYCYPKLSSVELKEPHRPEDLNERVVKMRRELLALKEIEKP